MSKTHELESTLEELLRRDESTEQRIDRCVQAIAEGFEASSCTFHQANDSGELLSLRSQVGIPDQLLPIIGKIPFGKGMAGICAERREAVTVCNLQTDASGVARPAAKETGVAGALVVPVLGESGQVQATLGVGKDGDYDYSDEEIDLLSRCAAALAREL
ncbi:MAG: GAF domain-containing protein [Planctomycetota bacterium]